MKKKNKNKINLSRDQIANKVLVSFLTDNNKTRQEEEGDNRFILFPRTHRSSFCLDVDTDTVTVTHFCLQIENGLMKMSTLKYEA